MVDCEGEEAYLQEEASKDWSSILMGSEDDAGKVDPPSSPICTCLGSIERRR
jgi:hypothetical protein